MALRLIKITGTIDGLNDQFSVGQAYVSGSLVIFRNGQQLDPDLDNGFVETDSATGEFQMKVPPLGPQGSVDDDGDTLHAAYQDGLDGGSLGGAEGGVPILEESIVVDPQILTALGLDPKLYTTSNLSDAVPTVVAELQQPIMSAGEELIPSIISVEVQ